MITSLMRASSNPKRMRVLELYQDTLKGYGDKLSVDIVKRGDVLSVADDIDLVIADGSVRENFDEALDYFTSNRITIGWFVKNPNKFEYSFSNTPPTSYTGFISNITDLDHVRVDDYEFIFNAGIDMDNDEFQRQDTTSSDSNRECDSDNDSDSPIPKRRKMTDFVESALSKMSAVLLAKDRLVTTLAKNRASVASAEETLAKHRAAVALAEKTLAKHRVLVVSAEEALAAAKAKEAETTDTHTSALEKACAMEKKKAKVLALIQSLRDECEDVV